MDAELTELYRKHWYLMVILLTATLMAGFVLGWTLRPMLDKQIIILPERGSEPRSMPRPT
jgi:hypothetical protein